MTICSLTLLQELSAAKKAITRKKKHNRSQMTDRKIKEGEHLEKRIDGWRKRAHIVLGIFPERWDRSPE